MDASGSSFIVLVFWVLALVFLLGKTWKERRSVVGLTLAYWFHLWLIHWLGGFIHVVLGYRSPTQTAALTGFGITGYAILGLLLGNFLAGLLSSASPRHGQLPSPARSSSSLATTYIVCGLLSYFVASRLLRGIPSVTSVTSCGIRLAIAGWCFLWYMYWTTGRQRKAWIVAGSVILMPVLTTMLQGFMGFGIIAVITFLSWPAVFYQPRVAVICGGLAIVFLGLSLYPVYMHVRTQIRKTVWGGASYEERLGTMALMATEWEWFDTEKGDQLKAIDARLNQNILVGYADAYISQGHTDFARGKTLWHSLLALIPRAVWPDKPAWAGSQGMVTQFTGVQFASNTSVGIGHVMELYINFGRPGVLFGYLFLGLILGLIDLQAGRYLMACDWKRCGLWYVAGMALLQVGGNFAEATSSAAGGIGLCLVVNSVIDDRGKTVGRIRSLQSPRKPA
jgi:hypothetical protein